MNDLIFLERLRGEARRASSARERWAMEGRADVPGWAQDAAQAKKRHRGIPKQPGKILRWIVERIIAGISLPRTHL